MAVTCSLLQVLNSMSTDDRNAIINKDITSAIESPSNKVLQVIGSLINGGEKISRRFPVIDFEDHSKLTILTETANVIFDRFLHGRKFNFSYTDNVTRQTDVLDSEEKMELVIQRHQQRSSSPTEGDNVDCSTNLTLDLEIIENSHTAPAASTELINDCLDEGNLVKCDCCGEETITPELGFKCLHCNSIFICSNCEISHEKHRNHLVITCMPRCAYSNVNN